ncbi:hypothetical protein [Heyndrickxia oleronia]|jgi:hypothetical protein|uniref:hypothetical protein n=1 Tax=Heyndrickxia oleronia TaxID=38875 RepID=UPI002430B7A7|nr:hypothetical protein [Heyndrickxia oleronia]MCI1763646.1 hypothetical protein [Heyndrickxia oleronia]
MKIFNFNINDLFKYLNNPITFRKELIKLSNYFYNKNGIVTDCYDTFKSLPILNYSIMWENMHQKTFASKKKSVDKFIEDIKVKKLSRDTIFQTMNEGICVWYNRDNKFIQFLEPDQYICEFMVNGKWQVFYDLNYIYTYKSNWTTPELLEFIRAMPDEVTLDKYVKYNNDRNNKNLRYVPLDIKRTQVFKFRGGRNDPYAPPYCIPALASIIHKDLLERTESAVADRVLNQIITQSVGSIPDAQGKGTMPAPPELVDHYHENLKGLLQGKNTTNENNGSTVAPLTIPDFVKIDALKVNMTDSIFPKETYDRIDRDIFNKLGYSQSLSAGGGVHQTYGSATINAEKVSAFIFNIVEQIEDALNEYIGYIVSNSQFNPKIRFGRVTYLNQDKEFERAEALYLKGRGSLKDYVEASGRDFDHWYSQVRYENEVLKLDEILPVHNTSFTSSGDSSGGRPQSDGKNDNTDKSNTSGGNNNPSPSD